VPVCRTASKSLPGLETRQQRASRGNAATEWWADGRRWPAARWRLVAVGSGQRATPCRRSSRERRYGFIVQVPHRVFDVGGEPFAVLHGLVDVIEEVAGGGVLDAHRPSGSG